MKRLMPLKRVVVIVTHEANREDSEEKRKIERTVNFERKG